MCNNIENIATDVRLYQYRVGQYVFNVIEEIQLFN